APSFVLDRRMANNCLIYSATTWITSRSRQKGDIASERPGTLSCAAKLRVKATTVVDSRSEHATTRAQRPAMSGGSSHDTRRIDMFLCDGRRRRGGVDVPRSSRGEGKRLAHRKDPSGRLAGRPLHDRPDRFGRRSGRASTHGRPAEAAHADTRKTASGLRPPP